jgi:hypothetical protein
MLYPTARMTLGDLNAAVGDARDDPIAAGQGQKDLGIHCAFGDSIRQQFISAELKPCSEKLDATRPLRCAFPQEVANEGLER